MPIIHDKNIEHYRWYPDPISKAFLSDQLLFERQI